MGNAVQFTIQGDEWWLNMEFQPEHETRQEWKNRTFMHRYGRWGTFKGLDSSPEPLSSISAEEAKEMFHKFKKTFDFGLIIGRGPTGPSALRAISRESAFLVLEEHYGHSIPRDE